MKINHFLISACFFSILLVLSACNEDKCKNVVCQTNANCMDGDCICDQGFEKDAQDSCVLVRDKFIGTYQANENCNGSGNSSYALSIIAGNSNQEVLINNFWNYFSNRVVGTISENSITIPAQNSSDDIFSVEGNGTINGNALTLNFTITEISTGESETCNATWNKN
ncbi:MAG: hypothetical protein KDC24_08430 [Saprospiraceae bacterium]|nr:hypothetical protein [Saprospiraceae bacterium]